MKKRLLFLLLAMSLPLFAQTTTYTTTADGCGGKNIGYCRVAATSDPASSVSAITFDNRSGGGVLYLDRTDNSYLQFKGAYTGFGGNPDGTHNDYDGVGTYDGYATIDSSGASPNGTAHGQLLFHAYYVGTCSGRGCGPVVVGWHYLIKSGSTVTVS